MKFQNLNETTGLTIIAVRVVVQNLKNIDFGIFINMNLFLKNQT